MNTATGTSTRHGTIGVKEMLDGKEIEVMAIVIMDAGNMGNVVNTIKPGK